MVAGGGAIVNRWGNAPKDEADDGQTIQVARDHKKLVMATSANYPPYEDWEGVDEANEATREAGSEEDAENRQIVGFDIDLARLIANRLERELSVVDVEFGAIIPALINDEVDMAMAALEPNSSRKREVDFSNIYYRSRQALVSVNGRLRSRDLNYQTIGIRAGSVQARFADRLSREYPDLDVIAYDSLEEVLEALDTGAVAGVIMEASIATAQLEGYPDFAMNIMPSDQPMGSAIALPKNSPLRRDLNTALSAIKASGEMDSLIAKWFT